MTVPGTLYDESPGISRNQYDYNSVINTMSKWSVTISRITVYR